MCIIENLDFTRRQECRYCTLGFRRWGLGGWQCLAETAAAVRRMWRERFFADGFFVDERFIDRLFADGLFIGDFC